MPLGARSRHGSCRINEHIMLILGGWDVNDKRCSDGIVYNIKTKEWWTLPHPTPAALAACSVVATANGRVYVVGGRGSSGKAVNTVYCLSLKTWRWTNMAPMGTGRYGCAIALAAGYIHVFGGEGGNGRVLKSVERYSIVDDTWEYLPSMAEERKYHSAALFGADNIVIVGGARSVLVFDVFLKRWKTKGAYNLRDMPGERHAAAVVALKNRYLMVIGGYRSEEVPDASSCYIFDWSSNRWFKTPASMNMSTPRRFHSATVLDGKIVVAGGYSNHDGCLSSMECIDVNTILNYEHFDLDRQERRKLLQMKPNEEVRTVVRGDCVFKWMHNISLNNFILPCIDFLDAMLF
mmetsp:Transcript_9321/g.14023  ORF Transcript_9321/g.14023 Transcript_9321/m.14023 type:complete len:349 (-) Transcript_9321:285-1331(-)|eukprot:CAMPEP_0116022698 /NCGR_PEP_ID=MMETSP0321-20121206/11135_1 /TAXON_ID=163516 /ORGANISM="Leptocylindrus danicus var. danicus, Strain B650" /LENGTH=348 /DNA_ID=CAMNT_0003493805 /DNA_START=162 /DNA_END=1208 /DNA_ORIENTATION=+